MIVKSVIESTSMYKNNQVNLTNIKNKMRVQSPDIRIRHNKSQEFLFALF